MEHNRSRKRWNATTKKDDACRVVINTEGPGRFDKTTSTVYVYPDFARVVHTKGAKPLHQHHAIFILCLLGTYGNDRTSSEV